MKTTQVRITCAEQDTATYSGEIEPGDTYVVEGYLLPDGRLVTIGSGVDGADSLWASIDEYAPNGLDTIASIEVTDETSELDDEVLAKADRDNVDYEKRSLLRASDFAHRVTVEPGKMGGAPCLRGLRIPVATVARYVEHGLSDGEILDLHPELELADVRAAALAASTRAAVEEGP